MGNFGILQILVVVFALSIATTTFNKRVLGFPQAIGTPIVAAIFVFSLQWGATLLAGNEYIHINIEGIKEQVVKFDLYNFLINGVICFILTASAINFKASDLKSHWKPISILASISLATCALIFACALYGFHFLTNNPIPFLILLLLGSALGATDPIGIKGVLSSFKAPKHILIKLEGESLGNDAVCIALFMTILSVINGKEFTIAGVAQLLAYEIAVAVAIGLAVGWCCIRFMRGKHEKESLILLIGLLAALSYLIALYVHASAPIASVVAGLYVGNKWHEVLTHEETHDVSHFWHTVEGVINPFLFTMIGLELFLIELNPQLILGGMVAFVILHFARFAGNGICFAFFPGLRKNRYNGSLAILGWGGVRGAISLALILAVCNMPALQPYASILIGYTFISVLMSGVVCGLGLPAVMNAFYHNPNEHTEGFLGWYQRMCHKLNRKGFKYIIGEDANGHEIISIYKPDVEKDQHGVATHDPSAPKDEIEDTQVSTKF